MQFKIGDIIINKKPYRGETPFKIISLIDDFNYIKCAWFDRDNFVFDECFCDLKQIDSLEYYEKIDNFDLWLDKNKADIIWRNNIAFLERCL